MRRAPALAALVALVAGALLLATADRPSGQAHAATTTCEKHTKRVVRHVKRHGRRKRVVHVHHYWTCTEYVTPSAPSATATAPAGTTSPPTTPPAEQPGSEPEPEPNAIGVIADDHGGKKSFTLSRQTVKAGKLTIQLNDKGEDEHTMALERVGPTKYGEPRLVELRAEAGKQATTSPPVEVEPGEYRMWCTIAHHAEEGMEAVIKVE